MRRNDLTPKGRGFRPRTYGLRIRPRKVHPELYVDKSRGAKLKFATGHNTCMFIDRFPCSLLSDLSIDAMDVTGEQQQDVEHKPFKQHLDKAANRVTPEAERHDQYDALHQTSLIWKGLSRHCESSGWDRPHCTPRCRFITSADANGNHIFLLARRPQKVTQILLPSHQVGSGFVQNNRVPVSESASV
ncbi:endoplasmic reticulum-Golgi intermediate compartment protein 3-like isoform X4 [Falco biarmicus]|uniref:endoplasmic reticulum-Golgi intermediate compartment protein 3-like isoform X4 n=1 Tax=Falco biarmicus TaxID=345155 RepID=UPI0024BD2AA9|nr:endoplasmic reticulum-Golgi intermediate compartment protein 3-like isoform X4 [Falco biarmicus]